MSFTAILLFHIKVVKFVLNPDQQPKNGDFIGRNGNSMEVGGNVEKVGTSTLSFSV